ncbi:hypothetical protein CHS0354_036652 [Potamilus streckersoni]|uniref:Sulfotransferase domain-containing protein n=1 Tax=Potamilus streckersoni TaxID=2493646 RepID=A0AAE0SRC2_9BIVA|nr:hypothetical protein CHS0354_036652 [Potamilus streckersoni]
MFKVKQIGTDIIQGKAYLIAHFYSSMTHKLEVIARQTEVVDGNGRKIPIVAVGKSHFPLGFINYRIPKCDIAGHLKDIQNLSMRNDDVLVCAFMKSGTHWLWEIVQMLLRGNAEYETKTKLSAMIDIRTPEELDAIASPRVLNTHLPVDMLPSDVLSKRISIIHIMRNPKDVAVSLYHHIKAMAPGGRSYPGGFHGFLPLFMDENNYILYYWFDYIIEYEQFKNRHRQFPILTVFYENLKKYPKEEILKIARFLGTRSDDHFIEEVVEKVEFHKLKMATEILKDDDSAKYYLGGKSFIYRKGE